MRNLATSYDLLFCSEHSRLEERHETKLFSGISDCVRLLACPQRIQPVTGKWAIAYFNIVKFYLSTDLGKIRIKIGKNLETVM